MPDNSVPSTSKPISVPATRPPQKSSVPSTTKQVDPSVATPVGAVTQLPVRDRKTSAARNQRVDTGQRLGVRLWDGTTREIEADRRHLAIVSGRILDRTIWSGLEIVEMK